MLPGRVANVHPPKDAAAPAVSYGGGMADEMSGHEARQRLSWGAGIAIGMGVGVAMGSALDNMGLGIAIGIAIGVVFAIVIGSAGRKRKPGAGDAADDLPTEEDPDSAP